MKLKKKLILLIYFLVIFIIGIFLSVVYKDVESPDVSDFFSLSFDDLNGDQILIQDLRGQKFTIINFWATWCAPCIEEMPMFSRFHKDNKKDGIRVIALAVDNRTQINKFLQNKNLSQPILIVGAKGNELARLLGSEKDALPFTALIGPNGKLLKTKMGKISENEVKLWVFSEFKHHL